MQIGRKTEHLAAGNRKFALGAVITSDSGERKATQNEIDAALERHVRGDWGAVSAEKWLENELAVRVGHCITSCHRSAAGYLFWITTDFDRRSTTIF